MGFAALGIRGDAAHRVPSALVQVSFGRGVRKRMEAQFCRAIGRRRLIGRSGRRKVKEFTQGLQRLVLKR